MAAGLMTDGGRRMNTTLYGLVLPLREAHKLSPGVNAVTLSNTTCRAFLTSKNFITLESERLLPVGQ